MRIIKIPPLKAYLEKHADAKGPLEAWINDAKRNDWKNPNHLKELYANASIIGNNRVVFNIGGNNHRLITAINFEVGIVLIKFVGTHAEYDKIEAETVELS